MNIESVFASFFAKATKDKKATPDKYPTKNDEVLNGGELRS